MLFDFGNNSTNDTPGTRQLLGREIFKTKSNSASKPETKLPSVKPFESLVKTATIPAPLERVVYHVYGPNSEWFCNFINNSEDLTLDKIENFPELQARSRRTYEYSSCAMHNDVLQLALNKSTETIESWDFDNYVEVITTTHTSYISDDSYFTFQTRAVFAALDDNTTEVRLGTWLKVGLHPMKVAGSEQESSCMRFMDELSSVDFTDFVSHPSFEMEKGALVALNPVESEQTEVTAIQLYAVDYEMLPQFASPWYVYLGVALVLMEFIILRFGGVILSMFTHAAIIHSFFDAILFIDPLMPFINVRVRFRWKQPMHHSHLALLDKLNGQVMLPVFNPRDILSNIHAVVRIERNVFFTTSKARRRRLRRISSGDTAVSTTNGIPPMVVRWSVLFTVNAKTFFIAVKVDNRF